MTVSRLDSFLKSESLFRTVEAVGVVARDLPVRLVIVGDGQVRADLERAADRVNAEHGRPVVVFTGALLDPAPGLRRRRHRRRDGRLRAAGDGLRRSR